MMLLDETEMTNMTYTATPAAMSVTAAAQYLSISRANLYRLIKAGELRPAKVGGRTLIRRVDADALLERSVSVPIARAKDDRSQVFDNVFA